MPDMPIADTSEYFDKDFYNLNYEKIKEAYLTLEDEESKNCFASVINYKLSGRISYLSDNCSTLDEMYSLLKTKEVKYAIDVGAYNGDTIRELMKYSPALSYVTAFEPDRRSFRKLSDFCDTLPENIHVNALHAAAWNEDAELSFGDEGNRNSGLFAKAKTVQIQATSLDNTLKGKAVDYVKYDVEGCEREAIVGSERTIASCAPKLLVSAYHRSEDIFALPLQIHALRPEYKLYLRRYAYVPAWDLNLICI
jgi:FkbM family methyltransferase